MAVYLKCLLVGEPSTGKSSLGRLLSGGKKLNNCYEATTVDPTTRSQVVFRIEERNELPKDAGMAACAMVVYDCTNEDTFEAVKEKYVPFLTKHMSADCSFIMLIGTHSDLKCNRSVDPSLAEEYAASNSLFHMEVSNTLKKNIDLTLKVMRIRATYLVKKHPEITQSRAVSPSLRGTKPPEIDFSVLSEEQESRESPSPTPQFSERHHGRKHSFEIKEEDLLNQCGNFSFPLQETDFNVLQLKKKQPRYDEVLADPSTIDTGNNLSFANMSGVSDSEDGDLACFLTMENRPQQSKSKEFTLQGEGLLDSQPKIAGKTTPVVPLLNIGNGSQTERRSLPPCSRSPQVGNSTDRLGKGRPLLELDVLLGKDVTTKACIYEGDTSLEVAQRLLGDLEDSEQMAGDLAGMIEAAVIRYCSQLQGVKRQSNPTIRHIVSERAIPSEGRKTPLRLDLKRSESAKPRTETAETPRKLLFKLKVNIGDHRSDVLVREGDDLEAVAHCFAERNCVYEMEGQVRDLLKSAMEKYRERKEDNVVT